MIPLLIWMITNSDNVHREQENEERRRDDGDLSGFSMALHVLLPVAGLALIFGRKDLFSKILQQLDRSCVSVFCPSLSRREKLLKWAGGRLPPRWSSRSIRTLSGGVSELWKDGSLLCTLINSAVPGACSNPHRHWKKPPLHAQALAYKYFGIAPIFTEDELSSDFCMHHERNFVRYLQDLQRAMDERPTRDDFNKCAKFTSRYLARGMGLYTGEENQKTTFYIYTNNRGAARGRNDVLMYVKGPYGAEGKTTIPARDDRVIKSNPFNGVLQNRLRSLKTTNKAHLLKTISLDFTSLIHDTSGDGKKVEIPIQIEMESDRVKVTYIPKNRGMYEINLITDGEIIKGSPFNVHILENQSGRKDSFTGTFEKVKEKVILTTRRKIISKVIDCIDEKICISNCGQVSTISNRDNEDNGGNLTNTTVTAISKNEDAIVKTEISCLLPEDKNCKIDAFHAITKISEELETSLEAAEVDNNSECKSVKNCVEAVAEIVNSLQEPAVIIKRNNETFPVSPHNNNNNQDESLGGKVDFIKNFIPLKFINSVSPSKETDDNNNKNNSPQKLVTNRVFLEIGPNHPPQDKYPLTSPICPDHIAPEVPYRELPSSEKRRLFGSQKNSSLSSVEIDAVSEKKEDSASMSVLNILDVLRNSDNNSGKSTLSSAKSLPSFRELTNQDDTSIVRIRRKYWEEMTSTSSSTTSLSLPPQSDSFVGQEKKFPINNKNIFNGSSIFNRDKLKKYQEFNEDMTKSADDIRAIRPGKILNNNKKSLSRRYKSFDDSIENCSVLSIEERKKILLKERYEREITSPRKFNKVNNNDNESQQNHISETSTVAKRIKKFDECKGSNLRKIANVVASNEIKDRSKDERQREKTDGKSNAGAFKSSFKNAIKFFRNLEGSDLKKIQGFHTRHNTLSLDSGRSKPSIVIARKSESLSLPNTYQRFSINNLYSDVIGSKNGSFKGVPNQVWLGHSLASFFENDKAADDNKDVQESKEAIRYELFINRAKTRKRKSLKTLFDVNY